jgi:hypothetical protein
VIVLHTTVIYYSTTTSVIMKKTDGWWTGSVTIVTSVTLAREVLSARRSGFEFHGDPSRLRR